APLLRRRRRLQRRRLQRRRPQRRLPRRRPRRRRRRLRRRPRAARAAPARPQRVPRARTSRPTARRRSEHRPPPMEHRTLGVEEAAQRLNAGAVLVYPTEAVFGLGCDPLNESAVRRLLSIKKREVGKGLILIAASLGQVAP